MSLCEIQPVGEESYYRDFPEPALGTDWIGLAQYHPDGYKVVPVDPKQHSYYVFFAHRDWNVAYFQDNPGIEKVLCFPLQGGYARFFLTEKEVLAILRTKFDCTGEGK